MKISSVVLALAGTILFSGVAQSQSQSLAEIARKEAERRKAIQAPARVYTDADLRRTVTTPPPEPPQPADRAKAAAADEKTAVETEGGVAAASPAAAGAAAGQVEPSVDLGEHYWRKLMSDARGALARSSSYLVALQERARALMTQMATHEDPAVRSAAAATRKKVLEDIDRLRQDMAAQTEAIAKIEADARKANVPPGWIR